MTKPFDYVNSINYDKKNLMRNSENDSLSEKGYNPWLTNKALSYFPDTVLHANLMNMQYHLDNRPQYEFLLNSIRKKKRFSKWVKEDKNDDLNLICKHYKCNMTVGKEYLKLMDVEQISELRSLYDEGGIKKGKKNE